MSPEEIERVRKSWQSMALLGDTAARMFYRRLFAIDESTYALFSGADMREQRRKFMDTFGLLVRNLEKINEAAPMLEDLGRMHGDHGVEDHHYDAVRQALMSTIETGLGQALDRDSRAAWDTAYELITKPMRRASSI